MATFVVAHGHGHRLGFGKKCGSCLRTGTRAIYPTYTGLGERVHLASRDVGLETHIADTLGCSIQDLGDVGLIGTATAVWWSWAWPTERRSAWPTRVP